MRGVVFESWKDVRLVGTWRGHRWGFWGDVRASCEPITDARLSGVTPTLPSAANRNIESRTTIFLRGCADADPHSRPMSQVEMGGDRCVLATFCLQREHPSAILGWSMVYLRFMTRRSIRTFLRQQPSAFGGRLLRCQLQASDSSVGRASPGTSRFGPGLDMS